MSSELHWLPGLRQSRGSISYHTFVVTKRKGGGQWTSRSIATCSRACRWCPTRARLGANAWNGPSCGASSQGRCCVISPPPPLLRSGHATKPRCCWRPSAPPMAACRASPPSAARLGSAAQHVAHTAARGRLDEYRSCPPPFRQCAHRGAPVHWCQQLTLAEPCFLLGLRCRDAAPQCTIHGS